LGTPSREHPGNALGTEHHGNRDTLGTPWERNITGTPWECLGNGNTLGTLWVFLKQRWVFPEKCVLPGVSVLVFPNVSKAVPVFPGVYPICTIHSTLDHTHRHTPTQVCARRQTHRHTHTHGTTGECVGRSDVRTYHQRVWWRSKGVPGCQEFP